MEKVDDRFNIIQCCYGQSEKKFKLAFATAAGHLVIPAGYYRGSIEGPCSLLLQSPDLLSWVLLLLFYNH